MKTHSSILAWIIQWTEEPGKLQSQARAGKVWRATTGSQSQTWLKWLRIHGQEKGRPASQFPAGYCFMQQTYYSPLPILAEKCETQKPQESGNEPMVQIQDSMEATCHGRVWSQGNRACTFWYIAWWDWRWITRDGAEGVWWRENQNWFLRSKD